MVNIFDRIVQYPNRIKLTLVNGTTDTYDVSKITGTVTKAGTTIDRTLLMAMQGFISCTTVIDLNSGTITATNSQGDILVTTVSPDGSSITEQFTSGGITITKTTTFSGNTVTEVIT